MKINPDGYDISPTRLILWEFKYSEFIAETWDKDQNFIIVFTNKVKTILSYDDIDRAQFYSDNGIKYYLPINIIG